MQNSLFLLFCARFNQSLNNRTIFFVFRYTKKIYTLLLCFLRNFFIYYYIPVKLSQHCINTFYSQQFLKIYHLYYKNHQLVHHLLLKQKKKQFFLYSIKDLAKFQNKIKTLINPLLLLETNQGILTHPEALKLKIGGQLVGIFYRYTKF